MSQAVLRRPSWKGSKESLAPRHGPLLVDPMIYRSDSPGPPPSSFPQGHPAAGGSQRVNPPLPPQVRSVTPPPSRGGAAPPPPSWDSNPASSTKRYSGNLDYLVPRVSPVPQGAAPGQRGISPGPHQPIIMQNSKFTFPPTSWSQGGPTQGDYLPGTNRQPPPPYPLSRHSPTDQQQAPATASSPSYVNGGAQPQSMMAPNRNSHNLDVYNLGPPQLWSQAAAAAQPQQQQPLPDEPSAQWQHHPPVRSNSFSSHPLGGRSAGSQPSPTTVTAVTQAPVLQPVKSTRVQKPELHTAVAPAHPPWMQPPPPQQQQQQQALLQPPPAPPYQEPPPASTSCSSASSSTPQIPEAPSYQGPPPPYPKHLLQQQQPCCPPSYEPTAGRQEASTEEEESGREAAAEKEKEKERKQITTSPVPVRRSKRDEERRGESGRIAAYSPQAFKFFMEQHVENVLKNHQQRILRRKQLECEMQRVRRTTTIQKSVISIICS